MLTEQNAVIEILAAAKAADAPKGSAEEQSIGTALGGVLDGGIGQVNSATVSGSGEQF